VLWRTVSFTAIRSWTASSVSFHFQSLRLALHSCLCLQHLCHDFLFLNQEGSYYPTIYSTYCICTTWWNATQLDIISCRDSGIYQSVNQPICNLYSPCTTMMSFRLNENHLSELTRNVHPTLVMCWCHWSKLSQWWLASYVYFIILPQDTLSTCRHLFNNRHWGTKYE